MSKLVPLWLSQHERHEDEPIVTIAEFSPNIVKGYVCEATNLIDQKTAPLPYNFADRLREALIYGIAPKDGITLYQFDRVELYYDLPHKNLISKGLAKWSSALSHHELDVINDLYVSAMYN